MNIKFKAAHNGLPFIYISASFKLDGKTYAVYNISKRNPFEVSLRQKYKTVKKT